MSQEQFEIVERLNELTDKQETLEGTKIVIMLRQFKSTHYAVNRNYQELSLAMANYEGNSALWNSGKERTLFFRELSRLLHNYLSSTFSLIRHNSRFCEKYSKLKEEYDARVNALEPNDCYVFIKDLRNITQHIEFPYLLTHFSREEQQIKQSILLEKQRLPSKKLSAGSKRYIRVNQEVDLKVVLNQYQCLIKDFYKWFYQRVGELYSKELEEFATIEKEICKLRSKLFQKDVSEQEI